MTGNGSFEDKPGPGHNNVMDWRGGELQTSQLRPQQCLPKTGWRWLKGCQGVLSLLTKSPQTPDSTPSVIVLSWGWCVDNQSIHVVHSRYLIISNPQSGGIVQSKHTSRLPQALLHQSASTGQRPSHSSQYYPRSAFSHICTLPLMHTHISRSACQIIQVSLIPLTCIGLPHISDK